MKYEQHNDTGLFRLYYSENEFVEVEDVVGDLKDVLEAGKLSFRKDLTVEDINNYVKNKMDKTVRKNKVAAPKPLVEWILEIINHFKQEEIKTKQPEMPVVDWLAVCLCGSTKFKEEFEILAKYLTLRGVLVHTVAYFGHHEVTPPTQEEKALLDKIHKKKIDLSDGIIVIDVDGYTGHSTKSEIGYAKMTGKKVSLLSQDPELQDVIYQHKEIKKKIDDLDMVYAGLISEFDLCIQTAKQVGDAEEQQLWEERKRLVEGMRKGLQIHQGKGYDPRGDDEKDWKRADQKLK